MQLNIHTLLLAITNFLLAQSVTTLALPITVTSAHSGDVVGHLASRRTPANASPQQLDQDTIPVRSARTGKTIAHLSSRRRVPANTPPPGAMFRRALVDEVEYD